MALAQASPSYTYADFLEWDEGDRGELLDGEFFMFAAPSTEHQRVLMELAYQIKDFLKGKSCKVFPAPFAVRLNPLADNSDDTVLEPDIVVVCDSSKLDKRGCNGAPDLVVEISSQSTARYDKVEKFRRYQAAGVREYWIVDPDSKTVQACVLEKGRYILSSYDDTSPAPVAILPGCRIDLETVFAEEAAG
jgi:Uma2 family endonuclease